MIEKEKIQNPTTQEEESLIDKPLDLNDPETIKKVRDEIANEVIKDNEIPEEQAEAFKQMLEEATMPVELKDEEFKLGDNELDIRGLSDKNIIQMFFRTLALQSVWLKNITTSLIDLTRLMMIHLDHEGVKDIVKATDDIIEKIKKQNQVKSEKLDNVKKDLN